MKNPSWTFDECPHRAVLSAVRLLLEKEFHQLALGYIKNDSARMRRLRLLALTQDRYANLLTQIVTEQLIDVASRHANYKLRAENRRLRQELAYYKGTLDQERIISSMLDAWLIGNLIDK